jgi:hypothetical protein
MCGRIGWQVVDHEIEPAELYSPPSHNVLELIAGTRPMRQANLGRFCAAAFKVRAALHAIKDVRILATKWIGNNTWLPENSFSSRSGLILAVMPAILDGGSCLCSGDSL